MRRSGGGRNHQNHEGVNAAKRVSSALVSCQSCYSFSELVSQSQEACGPVPPTKGHGQQRQHHIDSVWQRLPAGCRGVVERLSADYDFRKFVTTHCRDFRRRCGVNGLGYGDSPEPQLSGFGSDHHFGALIRKSKERSAKSSSLIRWGIRGDDEGAAFVSTSDFGLRPRNCALGDGSYAAASRD